MALTFQSAAKHWNFLIVYYILWHWLWEHWFITKFYGIDCLLRHRLFTTALIVYYVVGLFWHCSRSLLTLALIVYYGIDRLLRHWSFTIDYGTDFAFWLFILLFDDLLYTVALTLRARLGTWASGGAEQVCMYVCIYVCMYVCMYVHTCYVLPCSILRPRRCVCFMFLRPKNLYFRNEDIFIYYVLAAVFASCFYVLFKFRFVREAPKGGPL
jgi:hypothetical protein